MNIIIPTENGLLPDKYGKYAEKQYTYNGHACVSFPFSIENVPPETKSLALVLVDFDSTPVCGFTWIHWLACNIPKELTHIPENFSQQAPEGVIQGRNSACSKFFDADYDVKTMERFVGPKPPDKDHAYTLIVYALNDSLDVAPGYYLNEFRDAIQDKVLAKASADVISRC